MNGLQTESNTKMDNSPLTPIVIEKNGLERELYRWISSHEDFYFPQSTMRDGGKSKTL